MCQALRAPKTPSNSKADPAAGQTAAPRPSLGFGALCGLGFVGCSL